MTEGLSPRGRHLLRCLKSEHRAEPWRLLYRRVEDELPPDQRRAVNASLLAWYNTQFSAGVRRLDALTRKANQERLQHHPEMSEVLEQASAEMKNFESDLAHFRTHVEESR